MNCLYNFQSFVFYAMLQSIVVIKTAKWRTTNSQFTRAYSQLVKKSYEA